MCLTRPLAARAVARVRRELPEDVARDSVRDCWPAYRDALLALLEDNPLPAAIARPSRPTTVVVSDNDQQAPAKDVTAWPHDAIELIELHGDHLCRCVTRSCWRDSSATWCDATCRRRTLCSRACTCSDCWP